MCPCLLFSVTESPRWWAGPWLVGRPLDDDGMLEVLVPTRRTGIGRCATSRCPASAAPFRPRYSPRDYRAM